MKRPVLVDELVIAVQRLAEDDEEAEARESLRRALEQAYPWGYQSEEDFED
jgi:hypothetical protein